MKKIYTLEEIENIINKECSYEPEEFDNQSDNKENDEDYQNNDENNNENIIDEVIEVLKEYIKKDKNNTKALTLLGRAYYSTYRYNKKAEKLFKKVLLINPNDDKTLYYTAINYIYNFRGNEKYNEALKLIKKAIELNENDSAYWHLLGDINYENENYYAAIEYAEKAVKLNKSYVVHDSNYMEYYLTVIGESYFKLGKYDKAIEVFKEIIKLPRHDQSDFMYLGLSYFEKKEYDKAIENYEKVLEINDWYWGAENINPIDALAKSYMALGEYQKGIEVYKKYIKKDVSGCWRSIRSDCYNKDIEDYKYMIEAFNQLIEEEPSNFEYYDGLETIYSYDLNICDKAANVLEKYLLNNKEDINYRVYGTLADLYKNIYRYDEAIEMCNKLMEIDDFDSYYYSLLGHIYQKIKNYDKALEMYEKYLNFECRSSGNVYCNMTKLLDLYEQLSKKDKRDLFINKAINYYIDKNDYKGLYNLYLHIGEKYKAIEYYKKYIDLEDNKKYGYNFTAIAEIYESLGEKENAEEYYKKAIEIYENEKDKNNWTLEIIGDLYNSIGNKNKAIEAYKKAIKLEIKSASCMFRRENIFGRKEFKGYYSKEIGDLYMKIGNKNKALKSYKHAVSLEPNSKEYYVSIAEVYDGMNEKDLAKEYYQKAIDINKKYFEDRPYRCDILKDIAELYLKIDDKENAKECYRKILEINSYDDEAADYLKNLND